MSITCYVVDDEAHCTDLLREYIERTEGLTFLGSEHDPMVAEQKILSGTIRADITFLDIEMQGMDGIELAIRIKERTGIVFTTGHVEYGANAYALDAHDYLLKPITYRRFLEAVDKTRRNILARAKARETDFFFARDVMNGKLTKIDGREVQYIESNGNFVFIHTGQRKPIMTSGSMAGIAEKTGIQHLIRVHKGYVINLAHVDHVYGNEITMANGDKVPLSRRYRKPFLDKLGGKDIG